MSVKIIIVSQSNIGKALMAAANTTYTTLPIPIVTHCIQEDDDPDEFRDRLLAQVKQLDTGDGILILTDLYGSTPSNICHDVQNRSRVKIVVVAGINLPMLIKILNYPQSTLTVLAEKAVEGGKQGIYCSMSSSQPLGE